MKFGLKLLNEQIPEWKDAYFNYYMLKKLLSPFKLKSRMYVTGKIEDGQINSYIIRNRNELQKVQEEVEKKYIRIFFGDDLETQKSGKKKLRSIALEKSMSQTETFIFGLFLGFSIIFFGWIVVLFLRGTLNADDGGKGQKFEYIFPLFRGAALFIMSYWLIGLNIYGWNKYHINYKLIFKFGSHFSQINEVLRRAAVFTMVFLVFFIWYILVQYHRSHLNPILEWMPVQYCPIVFWILLIFYHTFLTKNWFNQKGNRYMWKLLKKCFMQPYGKMEFPIAWLTDQLISLGGAFKDMEYTLCYYIYDVSKHNTNSDYTCIGGHRPTAFILSLIPLYLRAVQCLKQCYQDGQFRKHPQFLNFFKYFSSIIASSLSYIVKVAQDSKYAFADGFFIAWLISAAFTTLYSYLWDLKRDWGFLEPGYNGLRKTLMYKKKYYYYIAIVNNLILRLVWVISISPDIISVFGVSKELMTFFIYFLEAFRRCQWNFLRVEKEHIANYDKYRAVLDLELKFLKIEKTQTNNIYMRTNTCDNQAIQYPFQNDMFKHRHGYNFNQLVNQRQDMNEAFEDENHSIINPSNIPIKDQQLQDTYEQNKNDWAIVDNTFEYYKMIQKKQSESFELQKILQNLKEFKDQLNKEGQTQYIFLL